MHEKRKTNIMDLFKEKKVLNVCAPMVRYSKLQFRNLVRLHNVDLCFTPMIIADSFCRSEKARQNEFTTDDGDTPLIVQYATNSEHELVSAAKMVYPYADGVDLNCGCPQKWAIQSGYGCALLTQTDLIKNMVTSVRNELPSSFSISVKIRLLHDIRETIQLCRQLEHCGISFITIHGRTASQKSEPVNVEAFVEVKKSIKVPLIVNGDIKDLEDAQKIYESTNCDGVMAGRGILSNPSLFDGTNTTNLDVIQEWMNICNAAGDQVIFQTYHHHLVFMLEKVLPKRLRSAFNQLSTKTAVNKYLEEFFGIVPQPVVKDYEKVTCHFNDSYYKKLHLHEICERCYNVKLKCSCLKPFYNLNKNGKYFQEACESDEYDGHMDFLGSTLFDQ